MEKFDEYLEKAKDLAGDASEIAKRAAGEVASKAKELADDHSKAKELMKEAKDKSAGFASGAREKTATIAAGAREKVQGIIQDSNAVKEIGQGITELENLPVFEGSIIYNMEIESMLSYLRGLQLIIKDNRLDDKSVEEEIRKVMDKVRPSCAQLAGGTAASDQEAGEAAQLTDEGRAIETARTTAYNACKRALATLGIAE